MKKNLFLLITLIGTTIYAQYYSEYDWEESPKLHELSDEDLQVPAIGVFKKTIIEFKNSEIVQDINIFETTHKITRLNNDAGIGRHNRIYIPMYNVKNIIELKARTISSTGEITDLDTNNIKEIENVEEYGDFKIFAIEGAEIGSEIEILYTVQKSFTPFGTKLLQTDYPIKRTEVVFINNDLNGSIKTYNTDMEFERTYIGNLLVNELIIEDIYPVVDEEYATVEANRIYVTYQCFGAQSLTQDDLWKNTIKNVAYGLFPHNDTLAIVNQIKSEIISNAKKSKSDFYNASLIDNYIKNNFITAENNNPNLNDIEYIFKNKTASDYSILAAYTHLLKAFNIEYQIVVTSNKYTQWFDPEFYNPNALRKFLIYLPEVKLYISPDRIDYRLSEPPTNVLDNYGLFISEDLGYYFAILQQNDDEYTGIKRKIDISFSENIEKAIIDEVQEYTGHWSALYRAVTTLLSGADKAEIEDQLTGSGIEDKNTLKFETLDGDMNQVTYNTPYVVNSIIESTALLEEAGDNYIFELGKVIGIQSELYQETERINPIVMQYPNQYNYKIVVNIPKGYKLEGLESIDIHKKLEVDGEILCKWDSSYKLKGKKLIITIEESYYQSEFPFEHYDKFRAVINAASDFNKASILISKK